LPSLRAKVFSSPSRDYANATPFGLEILLIMKTKKINLKKAIALNEKELQELLGGVYDEWKPCVNDDCDVLSESASDGTTTDTN